LERRVWSVEKSGSGIGRYYGDGVLIYVPTADPKYGKVITRTEEYLQYPPMEWGKAFDDNDLQNASREEFAAELR